MDGLAVPEGDEARRLYDELCAAEVEAALQQDSDRDLWMALERQYIGIPRYGRGQLAQVRKSAMTTAQIETERSLRGEIARLMLWEDRARQEDDRKRAVKFKVEREDAERSLRQLVETVQLRGRPGWELLFPKPMPLTAVRPMVARDQILVSMVNTETCVWISPTEVKRVQLEAGSRPGGGANSLVLIGPRTELRWEVGGIVRAPSATEFFLLKSRPARNDPLVLKRPPTMRRLRMLFLEGTLQVLAPSKPVAPLQAKTLQKRVAEGETLFLPATSHWTWWGHRP